MLDFEDPQVRFLQIDTFIYPYYPVNTLNDYGWILDKNYESIKESEKFSLPAYAIFKFLINTKFIYSLEEIKIIMPSEKDSFEDDLNNMIDSFKASSSTPIKLKKIKVCHNLPNLQIINLERTLNYYEFGSYNTHTLNQSWCI